MKITKLPSVVIRNPFSVSPLIKEKINIWMVTFRTIVFIILFGALMWFGFLANIQHEKNIMFDQKVNMELDKASKLQPGIVLDTTANIIEREGKIPTSVAKKYATWIYEASAKHGIDPLLILSVMRVESKFDYKVISPTGPIGLLQVAYTWHKDKTTQAGLFDPKNNIDVGTQILKEYSARSSSDVETLLKYNGSTGVSPSYAVNVLTYKKKFEAEIFSAVVKDI